MREFFIFEIKDEFKSLYQDKPSILYQILEQIYFLGEDNAKYSYSLFKQLTKKIDKDKLDQHIFIKYHQSIPYSKRKGIHYYNNPSHEEIGSLAIKKSYMLLKTNYYHSYFLKVLNGLNNNYFICDFKNQDYFFLENYNEVLSR